MTSSLAANWENFPMFSFLKFFKILFSFLVSIEIGGVSYSWPLGDGLGTPRKGFMTVAWLRMDVIYDTSVQQ